MQTVYIETSIVSFLRQNPAAAAESVRWQVITLEWWEQHRHRYDLVTAQYVVDEAAAGNAKFARERLRRLAGISLLPLSDEIDQLAAEIIARAILPADALVDVLHIGCAAVNRVDYLLTWNCKHIANPMILPRVFRTFDDYGLPFPVVCTRRTCSMSTNGKAPVDPLIEEIHEIRRQIAKRFDYDIHRISEDARRRQQQEGRPVWQPKIPSIPIVRSGESDAH